MAIDITKLNIEERQALANALHEAEVFPTNLIGSGSPAHIQAMIANMNDLRGVLQMQNATVARILDMVSPRPATPLPVEEAGTTDNPNDSEAPAS